MTQEEIRFSAPDLGAAEVDAASRALLSGWISTGGECLALEEELASYLGIEHVVATSSCTAALEICSAYLGLPRGSRIGVPTWTFVSSALAPYHRGLRPVPLDIELDTFNLCPDALRAAIEGPGGLDAVIAVHFAGTPLSGEIRDICAAADLPLIEDAAHALGASDDRGLIAGRGTAGACYSFYATKNLTSGEGGALATDDPDLAAFAQSFRLHGLSRDAWARYQPGSRTGSYDVVSDGLKANLADPLAAVARVQLERFPDLQRRRREMDEIYRSTLKDIDGIRVVPTEPHPMSANHLMMVVLPERADRDAVQRHMSAASVSTSIHFKPLHTFDWFAREGLHSGPGATPNADSVQERALSLPFHTLLSDADIDRVCRTLADALDA